MRHLATRLMIPAPSDHVWALITEYRSWPAWGISIRAVESDSIRVESEGTGRVKTIAGFWLPFSICEVDPGRSWLWEVAGIGATGHHVERIDDNQTLATFTVPWIVAPYLLILHVSLRRLRKLAAPP
ncbi:MAG: SRPBCC family protein [Acidimicrobiia bacterium]|nr:SRPBCC family protein [Acidimicrobiia bacterium]